MRRMVLTVVGISLLGLGAIGVFVPVLPTTPFVLGAAACLSGTPALRKRIVEAPFFRDYFERYRTGEGIPRKTVVGSLVFLWGMLLISMLVVGKLWLTVLLSLIGTAVTVHIMWMSRDRNKGGGQ